MQQPAQEQTTQPDQTAQEQPDISSVPFHGAEAVAGSADEGGHAGDPSTLSIILGSVFAFVLALIVLGFLYAFAARRFDLELFDLPFLS